MLTAVLSTIVLSVLIVWLLKPKRNKNLPPGPTPFPVIGNIVQLFLADPKYPDKAMVNLSKKYGDVMSLKLGSHNGCVVTSYEAYKDIFTKEESQGRYPFPFVTDRAFHKVLGIIWATGGMWNSLRKFTTKSLREFGFGKQRSMDILIQEEVSDMIDFMKNATSKNDGIMQIKAHDFAGSVVNILWSMVAGYKFPIGDETVAKIIEHGNNISLVTSQSNIYNAFPQLRFWFPELTNWNMHMNSHREYQNFVKGMIEKAKSDRASRADPEAQNFIEVFLDEIDKEAGNPNTYFTDEQLIVVLQDLFLAGSETTGTALTWSLLFLVLNPRVKEKLRNQVNQLFPKGQPIPIGDLKKFTYMKATLYEIFRCANIAAVPPPRMTIDDLSYGEYTIPKGTLLMASMHNILNDKSFWKDPENFRPERFIDETETKLVNYERAGCIFGLGKRICLGESLVWDAMSMYLANILRHFEFEEAEFEGRLPTSQDPLTSGTLNPQPYALKFRQL